MGKMLSVALLVLLALALAPQPAVSVQSFRRAEPGIERYVRRPRFSWTRI